jgi:hypothetical protein
MSSNSSESDDADYISQKYEIKLQEQWNQYQKKLDNDVQTIAMRVQR